MWLNIILMPLLMIIAVGSSVYSINSSLVVWSSISDEIGGPHSIISSAGIENIGSTLVLSLELFKICSPTLSVLIFGKNKFVGVIVGVSGLMITMVSIFVMYTYLDTNVHAINDKNYAEIEHQEYVKSMSKQIDSKRLNGSAGLSEMEHYSKSDKILVDMQNKLYEKKEYTGDQKIVSYAKSRHTQKMLFLVSVLAEIAVIACMFSLSVLVFSCSRKHKNSVLNSDTEEHPESIRRTLQEHYENTTRTQDPCTIRAENTTRTSTTPQEHAENTPENTRTPCSSDKNARELAKKTAPKNEGETKSTITPQEHTKNTNSHNNSHTKKVELLDVSYEIMEYMRKEKQPGIRKIMSEFGIGHKRASVALASLVDKKMIKKTTIGNKSYFEII